MEFLTELSKIAGSGNPIADAMVIGLVVIATMVIILVVLSTRRQPVAPTGGDRPVAGRLEKLEMTLNAFRTEVLRSLEIQRGESERVERELTAIREHLGAKGALPEQIVEKVAPAPEVVVTPEPVPVTTVEGLEKKLLGTRRGLFERLRGVFSRTPQMDEAALEEIKATLLGADLGPKMVELLVGAVKSELSRGAKVGEAEFEGLLKQKISEILSKDAPDDARIRPQRQDGAPSVVLVVGVNGAGKTTTIAKLAQHWMNDGAKVLMVAADTFRAAAVDQLEEWAKRLNVPIVAGAQGAKPAAVVFDGMQRAKSGDFDVVIIDTAGRLHTKANLMLELEGIRNSINRHIPGAPHETILVVDGSTGQNALNQAREFNDAAKLSGIVVTKLDGTPKGGVVVAVKHELGIPVRYIGVGEKPEDLRPFEPASFVEAIFAAQN